MKKMTAKQEQEVKALESEGDELLEKGNSYDCIEAMGKYFDAQDMLFKHAQDDSIDDGIEEEHFKTESIAYKNWYDALSSKIYKSHSALARAKK